MYRNKKVSIYFPCRNEELHLQSVLARVPKFVDEIIVVSNKSGDNTLSVAKNLGAIALQDDRTLNGIGYGYAHITGIEHATGDIIATADGDLTYPIEELPKIIDYMIDNDFDFISCNRYPLQKDTTISPTLRLGVFILNMEVRLLYGIKIKDILSGMWVFRKEIKDKLGSTMGDWNLSPQIKLNAISHKEIKFTEYSIVQHQRAGETKQAYWKTGFSHLWWIFKNRFK